MFATGSLVFFQPPSVRWNQQSLLLLKAPSLESDADGKLSRHPCTSKAIRKLEPTARVRASGSSTSSRESGGGNRNGPATSGTRSARMDPLVAGGRSGRLVALAAAATRSSS